MRVSSTIKTRLNSKFHVAELRTKELPLNTERRIHANSKRGEKIAIKKEGILN